MNLKLLTSFLVVLCICSMPSYSQTTIGSNKEPVKAAILDIKEKDPGSNNETATSGGMLISRVALNSLTSLEPLLDAASASDAEQKLLHTGLIVYNMNDTPSSLSKGLYYWDGSEWKLLMNKDISSLGPWNKVGGTDPSKLNTDSSYLNAKVVINSNSIASVNGVDATLTVASGDAVINELTIGKGKGKIADNTAIGINALKNTIASSSGNTAVGSSSLTDATGKSNTAVGYNTLSTLSTGAENTVIGADAGNITTGKNNLIIGSGVQAPTSTADNQINIGNTLFGIQGNTKENSKIGVGINKPDATLHMNGSMSLTKPANITNGKVLVVDSNGKVGKRETTPIQYAYALSKNEISISSISSVSTLNAGTDIVVPWDPAELSTVSNVIEFVPTQNAFKVNRAFAAEISGFANYQTGTTYPTNFSYTRDGGSALLNLKLQTSNDNGNTWQELSNTRGVWTYAELGDQPQTIETPIVIKDMEQGLLIRMVVQRPYNTGSSPAKLGLDHGSTAAIKKPNALPYSKGFRIVGL